MNKKIASEIAIGVIFIIAFAIGAFFFLQSKRENKPTALPSLPKNASNNLGGAPEGWKKFSNQSIEFYYSPDWEVNASGITSNGFDISFKKTADNFGGISFNVKSKISPNSLVASEERSENLERSLGSKITNKSNFEVDNYQAMQYDKEFNADGKKYYASDMFIDFEDYLITARMHGQRESDLKDIHNVYKSFKLANGKAVNSVVTSSLDLSTWQNFENDSISFKYPAHWTLQNTTVSSPDKTLRMLFLPPTKNESGDSLEEYYNGLLRLSGEKSNERDVLIDGLSAKAYDVTNSTGKSTNTVFLVGDYFYDIVFIPDINNVYMLNILKTIKIKSH